MSSINHQRADRTVRFEKVATPAFEAAIRGGIPRGEAELKMSAVAEALMQLFAKNGWMLHREGESGMQEWHRRVEGVRRAQREVHRLGIAIHAEAALVQNGVDEYARFLEMERMARSPERHRVSFDELNAYQRLLCKYGRYQVDSVLPPVIDPLYPTANALPVLNTDCRPIQGDRPRICPRAAPKLPTEDLPAINGRFRELGLVGEGQTVLWVGHQAKSETWCGYPRCGCFDTAPASCQQAGKSENDEEDRSDPQKRLSPSREKAYGEFLQATRDNPELANASDRKVYEWLVSKADDIDLPAFKNWTRYLRAARRVHDAQKNSRRAGRGGRSIVSEADIETRKADK